MNKKIKILIVGLVLLMGNSVKADLHDWQYFKSKAGETTPQTIDLSQYMNPLIWEENGVVIVNGDHTFVGLSDMLAILDGTNATPLGGFISEKIINFHNNFEFRNFDVVFMLNTNSITNFTNSTINFLKNFSEGMSVISANRNSIINFTNSAVNFSSNTNRTTLGGAIYAYDAPNSPSINFTSSLVNFINNEGFFGGAIYVYGASSVNFTSSEVNFASNSARRIGGALYCIRQTLSPNNIIYSPIIDFLNSTVSFTGNKANEKGSAIYLEHSTISFINTKATFVENRGSTAIWAKSSQINISGDMEFHDNDGDIWLEGGSSLIFLPESGKTIKFKGKFDPTIAADNKIMKTGAGKVVFESEIHVPRVDFLIAEGTAHFEASSNTFKELKVSSAGGLGISIDFANLERISEISSFYVETSSFAVGASLSVNTMRGLNAAIGSSAPFVYTQISSTDIFASIVDISGRYVYSFSWGDYGSYENVGILRLDSINSDIPDIPDPEVDPADPPPPPPTPPTPDGMSSFNALLKSALPSFTVNAIRQAAISDNSPLYSNVREKVWVLPQASGGSLGDFGSSAAGVKGGWTFVDREDFSAGAFAGFASRSYKQDGKKASGGDMDFGFYGGYALGHKVDLAGFVGYGLQSVKVDGVEFDANVIKFGARAEYDAGGVSPFVGLEGAVVDTGDVDLGGATLEAASYTRLSSQLGAKIARQVGKLSW